MFNSLGNLFRITSYGESHGVGVGVVLDGCPSGIEIEYEFIQNELDRRKPGQSIITTQRKEEDEFEILSGVFNGVTTGSPILIIIKNKDAKSNDYSHVKDIFRPSHADYTYEKKYGIRDYRGGGRSSARITAGWVAAGAIAKLILRKKNVICKAFVSQVGSLKLKKSYHDLELSKIDSNPVRCPDTEMAKQMFYLIDATRKNRDTIGGVITGIISGLPVGIGEPIFGKLNAALGGAMLTINAVKGVEFGSGFDGVKMKGSDHNDAFENVDGITRTVTNRSGGIQGGISNGEDIYFNVGFKPVATIMKPQQSVDKTGNNAIVEGRGRHDPCVVPRAVPIVEAMAALVITDFYLIAQTKIKQD